MKSIFAAALLAIGIAAQREREDKSGEEIDWDNMPDRLCTSGDENCWEWREESEDISGENSTDDSTNNDDNWREQLPDYKREQIIDEIDWDNMPDKLCSNGQFGCHDWDDNDGSEKKEGGDGDTVINIFDDFFRQGATGLTATIAIGAASSALMLAF